MEALYQAARDGNHLLVSELVNHQGNLNTLGIEGGSPLHAAAEEGHEAVVNTLLQARADAEVRDKLAWDTPLHTAVQRGHDRIVGLLVTANADVNTGNRDGMRPVHYAAMYRHGAIQEYLLQNGAEAEPRCAHGQTPADITEDVARLPWCNAR